MAGSDLISTVRLAIGSVRRVEWHRMALAQERYKKLSFSYISAIWPDVARARVTVGDASCAPDPHPDQG